MSETDDDEEFLDKMYINQNYGTSKEKDEHVKKLLEKMQETDKLNPMTEEEKKEEEMEVNAYEQILKEGEEMRGEIGQVYKLFNTVCQASSEQILRYLEPALYRNQEVLPLWASGHNVLMPEQVPKCQRCNQPRFFEL